MHFQSLPISGRLHEMQRARTQVMMDLPASLHTRHDTTMYLTMYSWGPPCDCVSNTAMNGSEMSGVSIADLVSQLEGEAGQQERQSGDQACFG